MNRYRHTARMVLALAALMGTASALGSAEEGRRVYERHCRTCHGGTAPADSPIGPPLAGIFGRKAGAGNSGVHSRAVIDSGNVWDRASLRRYITDPRREIPGAIMPARAMEPEELERLLDYLESLR